MVWRRVESEWEKDEVYKFYKFALGDMFLHHHEQPNVDSYGAENSPQQLHYFPLFV